MPTQLRSETDLNQSPPYVDVDLYASDAPLSDAVAANGGTDQCDRENLCGRKNECNRWRKTINCQNQCCFRIANPLNPNQSANGRFFSPFARHPRFLSGHHWRARLLDFGRHVFCQIDQIKIAESQGRRFGIAGPVARLTAS